LSGDGFGLPINILLKTIETISSGAESDLSIQASLLFLDNGDVVVVVYGGLDHIGAVCLTVPRPSLQNPELTSATSSILTMTGHKEDVMVKEIGEQVAAATGRNIVVVGGVHYDNLTPAQLDILRKLWGILTEKIIVGIGDTSGDR
jgi:hypothetical protein